MQLEEKLDLQKGFKSTKLFSSMTYKSIKGGYRRTVIPIHH
jgi:hypothetical protein